MRASLEPCREADTDDKNSPLHRCWHVLTKLPVTALAQPASFTATEPLHSHALPDGG